MKINYLPSTVQATGLYGLHVTPFGIYLLATIEHQLCYGAFITTHNALILLQECWPCVTFVNDQHAIQAVLESIFGNAQELVCVVNGTTFQQQVWQALLAVPSGSTVSYQHVAQAINKPTAVRAVATAIASNNISYVIPCHRVIRKSGHINQYRWGIEIKKQLLAAEKIYK